MSAGGTGIDNCPVKLGNLRQIANMYDRVNQGSDSTWTLSTSSGQGSVGTWTPTVSSPDFFYGKQQLISVVCSGTRESGTEYWSFEPFTFIEDRIEQENAHLRLENQTLSLRVQALEERIDNLESGIAKEEIIVLREISRDAAKAEIAGLFSKGEILYYSDIAKRLNIDLELVVNICEELLQEGKINVASNS